MNGKIWHFKKFEELSASELYVILQVRNGVFVVEQDCIYNDCDGKDVFCYHLWCEKKGELIAYCRILPPGISFTEPSIGRVLTKRHYRNLSLGSELMLLALQVCDNLYRNSPIRISAQSYLKNFYVKFGFKPVSDEYLEDGIPHMEMLKS